jgi:hypothetical protein
MTAMSLICISPTFWVLLALPLACLCVQDGAGVRSSHFLSFSGHIMIAGSDLPASIEVGGPSAKGAPGNSPFPASNFAMFQVLCRGSAEPGLRIFDEASRQRGLVI